MNLFNYWRKIKETEIPQNTPEQNRKIFAGILFVLGVSVTLSFKVLRSTIIFPAPFYTAMFLVGIAYASVVIAAPLYLVKSYSKYFWVVASALFFAGNMMLSAAILYLQN